MRVELLVPLVEPVDRKEERLWIANVHGDRQAKTAARVPHRIEPRVVDPHELPVVPPSRR